MRVLHISNNYYQTEVYRNLYSALEKYCFVKILVPLSNELYGEFETKKTLQNEIHCFLGRKRIFGVQINSSHIAKHIISKGISEDIDLVHAHFVTSDGAIAYKLFKATGIPYVVSVRASCLKVFDRKVAFHNIITALSVLINASQIIFQTPVARTKLMEKVPVWLRKKLFEKSEVIPNGIDSFWLQNKFFLRPPIQGRNFTILSVARVELNKNLVTVAQVVQKLNEKGYRVEYKIAGSVKDPFILEELAKYDHTQFIGACCRDELLKVYRESDIFVMVSHKETFGLVYGEAMSQGLPVIYSRGEGFDGQFEEGEVGYHALPDNLQQIEDVVLKVVFGYKRLSDNALREVDRFEWDSIAMKYYQIYSNSVSR
jgi:glycosyltransferase involved in cell wall biosynthesis